MANIRSSFVPEKQILAFALSALKTKIQLVEQ